MNDELQSKLAAILGSLSEQVQSATPRAAPAATAKAEVATTLSDAIKRGDKAEVDRIVGEMVDEVDRELDNEDAMLTATEKAGILARAKIRAEQLKEAERDGFEKALRECIGICDQVVACGPVDVIKTMLLKKLTPPTATEKRYVELLPRGSDTTTSKPLTPDAIRREHGWFTEQEVREALTGYGRGIPLLGPDARDKVCAALRAAAKGGE